MLRFTERKDKEILIDLCTLITRETTYLQISILEAVQQSSISINLLIYCNIAENVFIWKMEWYLSNVRNAIRCTCCTSDICGENLFPNRHLSVRIRSSPTCPWDFLNKVIIWYYCICTLFRQRSIYNLMFIETIYSFFLSRNTFTNF